MSTQNSSFSLEVAVEAAERKRTRGDILGAYADYQGIAAERLREDFIWRAADVSVLQSLADLAVFCGDFQPADNILSAVVGLCRRENNIHRADYATIKRIHLAIDQGQLRQAQALFGEISTSIGLIHEIDITPQGLEVWERLCRWPNTDTADRTVLFTLLYLEMGRLLVALGQYRDAIEMLNRGLTHATPGNSQMFPSLARQQIPWFKFAIARACLESGLLPEAEAALRSLQGFLESRQEQSLQIQWHTLSGKLALLRGLFGKALEHFQTILELCHQLKIQRGVVIASLNFSQILILLNQNRVAEIHLASITSDVEKLQDPHLKSRLALLEKLAQARSQSLVAGSTLSVSDLLQANITPEPKPDVKDDDFTFTHTQSPNYLTFFEDRVLEFQWYLSESNLQQATQMLTHIQSVFADTDSRLIQAKIKALKGMLTYYQGLHQIHAGNLDNGQKQIRQAALVLNEVREPLDIMELKPELWQVQRILGWCLMRIQSSSRDQELLTSETTQLLNELTDSLSPEQQAIFLLNKWTAEEEYLVAKIVKLRQLHQHLQKAPLYQRPKLWWQLLQRLNGLVNHIDNYRGVLAKRTIQAGTKKTASSATHSLLKRLIKHPWRRATITFLVLPDQIFVVRNWRFWLDFSVVPLTRLDLRNTVKQWYDTFETRRDSREASVVPDLENIQKSRDIGPSKKKININSETQDTAILARKLNLTSLLKLPRYIRRLTIVPDDVLHIFPFAAVKHEERYLIESYALNIAYQTVKPKPQPSSPSPSTHEALLVGVSQGGEQFLPLPGVKRELESIYTQLCQQRSNPQVLLDSDADKETVLSRLESTSLLHIACHGIFQHDRAEQSGLVLAPQKLPPDILSLREIANLDLARLQHITLSACSSADHLVLPGRWVISLPETLWRAGAHSILGNLWQVYDQFAIAFMSKFYEYLQTMPRDEALQKTQLDCLHQRISMDRGIDVSNPEYWSGFNLYGEFGHWKGE